ncbi:hypothetical protein WA026_021908 [Henosepilachna vigintioctopunctata]|uniref:Uncharacterized protein n=1 Tax=Henosepilachna vigintioctopunctata TaxID=420089 RepID=A0AAW1UPV0_9CUCU
MTDVMFLCDDISVNYLDSAINDRKLLSDSLNLTVISVLPISLFFNAGDKTTNSKLDYVLTNAERNQFEVVVVEANLSDHTIINLDFFFSSPLLSPISSPPKSVRIMNDFTLSSFYTMLENTDFDNLYSNSDEHITFKNISDLFQSAMYVCIPSENVSVVIMLG